MELLPRRFRSAFLQISFFSLIINLLMLSPALFMLQVFNRVLYSRSNDTLLLLLLIALFSLVIAGWLDTIRIQLLNRLGTLAEEHLRTAAFASLWGWPPRNDPGDQALEDVQAVASFLGGPIKAFFDVPWFPIFLGIIFLFHPLLALVTVVGAILMVALALAEEMVERRTLATSAGDRSRVQGFVRETLARQESILGLGMRGAVARRWQRLHDVYLDNQASSADATSRISSTAHVTRGLIRMIGLATATWLIINVPDMPPGIIIASGILMGQALQPISGAIGAWKSFVKARRAHGRLRDTVCAFRQEEEIRASRLHLPRPTGLLTVEQAHWVARDKLVLNNISFQLQPGESLGVIGLNAAGKTSLARLLVGLVPPSSGRVTLDGADIYPWMQAGLGAYLGYLPQQIELFSGSVAENIARLEDIEGQEEAIVRAARRARIHEAILRLPQGYDTQIGGGGNTLSGGQRQQLALARALYGEPTLVVLDEPNASLDGLAELRLLETFQELKEREVTLVIVSHKPSVLRNVDKLLVLNQGRQMHYGPRTTILDILDQERQGDAEPEGTRRPPRLPQPDTESGGNLP